jgi:predicted component of type VI protein secretion system
VARLRVTDGGMAFDIYLDDKLKVIVGRDDVCDVLIEESEASRQHCRIELTPAGFLLTDLGSSNGTEVNGRPVTEHPMRNGDEVAIGACRIKFHDPNEAERLAAAAAAGFLPGVALPTEDSPPADADSPADAPGKTPAKKRSGRRRAAGGSGRSRAEGGGPPRRRRR